MEKLLLGTFYTMDRDNPCVEAVGIEHGKIVFAGSRKDAERLSAKENSRLFRPKNAIRR